MTKLARISKRTVSEALAEAAKELPGVGSALAVLGGVFRARTEVKFQTFLEQIGKPLAFGNWERVVGHITDNIEEPWMLDGLEEGWKTAQDTLDSVAKLCVFVMVADYLASKREPDRFFRRFSNLFMDSDAELLRNVLAFADHLHDAEWPTAELVWTHEPDAPVQSKKYKELILGHSKAVRLSLVGLEETADLLIRHGLAGEHSGFGNIHPDHENTHTFSYLCLFEDQHIPLWKRLRPYLRPVRSHPAP